MAAQYVWVIVRAVFRIDVLESIYTEYVTGSTPYTKTVLGSKSQISIMLDKQNALQLAADLIQKDFNVHIRIP